MFNPLNKIKYAISYTYRNIVYPRILTRKYKNVLNKNLEIKDIYNGKRCFVLGNGPSIKDIDLDKLADEHVFVVNEFNRHPQYKYLRHVYHTIPDTGYFTEDKGTYFWERLKHKSDTATANTTFFFNIKGKSLIDKEALFPNNKIYYLSTQGIISDHFDFNIDLHKTLPWPKNCVLSSLMTAVYMGFKEIYILGCEHSFLAHNIGLGPGKSKAFDHFYVNEELENISKMEDKTAEEEIMVKRYMRNREIDFGPYNYEYSIVQTLQLFKNYRLFYEKVRNKYPDIKILNATPNSFLDVFPSINYDEINNL